MARSYRKNIIRTLGSTKSRFLSIFAIVALGVGFLAGLMSTPPDMKDSAELYLDTTNFYDLRVVSTLGLTEKDAEALAAVEGIDGVQPAYSADLVVQTGGAEENGDVVVARAHSLPVDAQGDPEGETVINRLLLEEGRWPERPGECVVEAGAGDLVRGFGVGDTFTATSENEDLDTKVNMTEYTVVGMVRSSGYFSFEREPASIGSGTVGAVFYLRPQDFAYEAYTEIYLTAANARALDSLEDEYDVLMGRVTDTVEGISDARCEARYDELFSEARAEIDDAWKEYREAEQEADEELTDAAEKLADGRKQLEDGEKELADGEAEYQDGLAQLADNEKLIAEGLEQLDAARAQLVEGQAAYDEGLAQLQDGEAQLAAAKAQLEEGQRQYEEGKAAYDAALAQIEDGEAQLNAARVQLEQAQAQYDTGAAELESKRPELEAAQKQLEQSRAELEVGRTQLAALQQLNEGEKAYQTGIQTLVQGLQQVNLTVSEEAVEALIRQVAAMPEEQRPTTLDEWLPLLLTALEQEGSSPFPGMDQTTLIMMLKLLLANDPQLAEQVNAMIQGLNQLVAARIQLDAGIQTIVESGAAENEEAARLLFSDESLAGLQEQLEQGETALKEGEAQLAEGLSQVQQAEAQLAVAKAQLEEGWNQYHQNASTLTAGRAELEATAPQLEAAKAQLDAGLAQYEAQGSALYDALNQLRASKTVLDTGWATLTDKQNELADAQRQIADAKVKLADARTTLEDARATIAEKKQELLDGEIEYADAKAEVEQKLADAKAEIEDGESKLNDLERPEWYVWDRSQNVSYASFDSNVAKLQALTTIFPLFFFLVAALVVSTTMTRMVEEERLQIGTMKALGYTQGDIMKKYLVYALAASLAGTVVGLAIGFVAFPTVIWTAYQMMYYTPSFACPWRWNYALLAGGVLTGGALLVTFSACANTLRENPAALMRPRAPRAGKRILLERVTFLWKRLPFSYKVTCRNLLRYKKRFWMTVVGVAGCTSLLVAGFGISDSLDSIITKQYGDIYQYQLMTILTKEEATAQGPAYEYLFEQPELFSESLAVSMEHVTQDTPNGTSDAYLLIPREVDRFADFADLHERIGRKPTPLSEDGVVLTEKLAKEFGASAGDTVTLKNTDGETGEFTVSGVCEHYVSNYVYMSEATYRAGFGTAPSYNAVLSTMPDDSQAVRDETSGVLLAMDEVGSVSFTQDNIQMVLNMLTSIDAVVVLIIVCAACLAFVVLYNLSNINIAERVKEIATIKVLGFYDPEVNAYVNRESVALTLIGALLGLVLGIALHQFIIVTVEVDAVMFGRSIEPISFVYAFALTLLFSAVVNLVMNRKLKRVSMVESMKAPE